MATFAIRRDLANTLLPSAKALPNSVKVCNAGLELDKYLLKAEAGAGDKSYREALFSRVCSRPAPQMYANALEKWEQRLAETYSDRLVTVRMETTSPLVVGLGDESVHESSILLHHLYGTPLIPGSALKGLARTWVRHERQRQDDQNLAPRVPEPENKVPDPTTHTILFGDQIDAGHIVWCDAWFIPAEAPTASLRRDVITVHHPEYYGHRGSDNVNPPWDFDDPNPNPFISTAGTFLFAIAGPTRKWSEFAQDILARALCEYGVGAKTSSGYGRFSMPDRVGPSDEQGKTVALPRLSDVAAKLWKRIDQLPAMERGPRQRATDETYQEWERLGEDKLETAKYFLTVMHTQVHTTWIQGKPGRFLMRWVLECDPGWTP